MAQKVMNKKYFIFDEKDNTVKIGKDIQLTRAPQKYNFKAIQQLL